MGVIFAVVLGVMRAEIEHCQRKISGSLVDRSSRDSYGSIS